MEANFIHFTVSVVADIICNGRTAIGSSFVNGAFGVHADSVIFTGGLSTRCVVWIETFACVG